jgi:hypothetical protein
MAAPGRAASLKDDRVSQGAVILVKFAGEVHVGNVGIATNRLDTPVCSDAGRFDSDRRVA